MSKEHKNKRDTKKKPVMSPKEKKAAKLVKKGHEEYPGELTGIVPAYQICLICTA